MCFGPGKRLSTRAFFCGGENKDGESILALVVPNFKSSRNEGDREGRDDLRSVREVSVVVVVRIGKSVRRKKAVSRGNGQESMNCKGT